jgi:hypothetical protein
MVLFSVILNFSKVAFFSEKKHISCSAKKNPPNFSPKKFHKVMKSCHKTNGLTSVGTIIHDMCKIS